MYSRLETSPSLFLDLPGIFEARLFSSAPRIPVNPADIGPDIRESRYSSEAQKGLVSSLHVFRMGFRSVCAHDDNDDKQLTLSNLKARRKSFIYRKQSNANRNQSNANRIQSNANRN